MELYGKLPAVVTWCYKMQKHTFDASGVAILLSYMMATFSMLKEDGYASISWEHKSLVTSTSKWETRFSQMSKFHVPFRKPAEKKASKAKTSDKA